MHLWSATQHDAPVVVRRVYRVALQLAPDVLLRGFEETASLSHRKLGASPPAKPQTIDAETLNQNDAIQQTSMSIAAFCWAEADGGLFKTLHVAIGCFAWCPSSKASSTGALELSSSHAKKCVEGCFGKHLCCRILPLVGPP